MLSRMAGEEIERIFRVDTITGNVKSLSFWRVGWTIFEVKEKLLVPMEMHKK